MKRWRGSTRVASLFLGLLGLLLFAAACSEKPADCACSSSAQCAVGEVCKDCACQPGCTSAADCGTAHPNCDTRTGSCFGSCLLSSDCKDPATPACDGIAGLCRPPCPAWPCEGFTPNCDEKTGQCLAACPQTVCAAIGKATCGTDGRCYDPCSSNQDCPNPDLPNCDPDTQLCVAPCQNDGQCPPGAPVCDADTGLCQGLCPAVSCPPSQPVCEPTSGRCLPPCRSGGDCRDPQLPNCGDDGHCHPPCASHADCSLADRPNCDRDPASPTHGQCMPPCESGSCPNATPRCDAGLCEVACVSDADCSAPRVCHSSGLCLPPSCVADAECAPPRFVCDAGGCAPGCSSHLDCPSAQRCVLQGSLVGHCEARDCVGDADCAPPRKVCDSAGGGLPQGGGYCVDGCSRDWDCPIGQGCATSTGACSAVNYGAIGSACPGGDCAACPSGLGVTDASGTMRCTALCCQQRGCPQGYQCRPTQDPDPSCSACQIRICQPAPALGGARRAFAACAVNADCRSGVCAGGLCKETCCRDADCIGEVCTVVAGGQLACLAGAPADDLGATGCATPPLAPTRSCNAGLCSAVVAPDTRCSSVADCPPDANSWCGDYDGQQDANDCVLDLCTHPCCEASDCAGSVSGRRHFCGKQSYGAYGDFDLCLLAPSSATAAAGASCSADAQCASGFCGAGGRCLARCCEDVSCGPGKRCKLEPHAVFGQTRYVGICR